MSDPGRFERMAARARARAAERELAYDAALDERFGPAFPGEGDPDLYPGRHYGHRSHLHPRNATVVCQCGAHLGTGSFVIDVDEPEPPPCPVCSARGLES